MCRRLRGSSRVCLFAPQTPVRHETKPKSLVSTMVLDMHIIRLQKLVTDGCVHIKYVNNKKTKQHTPKINLNDLAKHLKQLPTHDRIYPDSPHDTAIITVVTYVDDNLVFTNCETMPPTVRSSQQQARPLQRRGARLLVPRHTIRPRPHHRSRTCITRTVHQQAPSTMAHVRLQPNEDTVLR